MKQQHLSEEENARQTNQAYFQSVHAYGREQPAAPHHFDRQGPPSQGNSFLGYGSSPGVKLNSQGQTVAAPTVKHLKQVSSTRRSHS